MNKKEYLVIIVSGITIALSACSVKKENNTAETSPYSVLEKNTADDTADYEKNLGASETQQDLDTAGTWEDAYRSIICNKDDNLADPYNLRIDSDIYVYLGIHDFNEDDIPELIIGDCASVAVFTYENGSAVKIADLYEPEEWGGINGLYFKDNHIILTSSGSQGSCYTCFTYREGEYITGIFDEYNPDRGIINGQQVTGEEFHRLFDLTRLADGSRIEYCRVYEENGVNVRIDDKNMVIDDLDFQLLKW